MFEPSKKSYLGWQKKIKSSIWFRKWWQFWANYSTVFFVVAFVLFIGTSYFYDLIVMGALSFVICRGIVVSLINLFYKKERPYQKYNFEPITSRFFSLTTTQFNSFPSRHVSSLASVAGVILLFSPVIGWSLLIVALLTGMARIILGYHYPADILFGLLIGLITAFLSFQICIILIFT